MNTAGSRNRASEADKGPHRRNRSIHPRTGRLSRQNWTRNEVVGFPKAQTNGWLHAAAFRTASCFADVMAKIKSGESADRRSYRAKLVVERLTGKPVQTFLNDAMKLEHRARSHWHVWPMKPAPAIWCRKSACACTMNWSAAPAGRFD